MSIKEPMKRHALYLFTFNNWFSETICSPLLAATLAVGTEIPSVAARWVMVSPSSAVPSSR